MKRILSFALVILAVFSLTIPMALNCFAAVSPEDPGEEFNIETHSSEGGKIIYKRNKDGSVEFTAIPDKDHEFNSWRITGEYEYIQGNDKTKLIILNPDSDLEVYGLFDSKLKCVVEATKGGKASYKWNEDGTLTIIATALKGHHFTGWKIDGEYTILEGSAKTEIVLMDPTTDIYGLAMFDSNTKPIKPTDDEESPDTGYSVLPAALFAAASLFGVAYCAKRSKEN